LGKSKAIKSWVVLSIRLETVQTTSSIACSYAETLCIVASSSLETINIIAIAPR